MSKDYITESEKFLAEDESLGESNNGTSLGSKEEVKTCVHHWLIDPPSGNKSSGICKICGEFRKDYFANSSDNVGWSGGPRIAKRHVPRNKNREKKEKDERTRVNEIRDGDLI